MTPEYRIDTEKRIIHYFKSYNDSEAITNIKCEKTFSDLDYDVNVWNIKTIKEAFWVVEGKDIPMNIYTQNAFYFSADEAYSFHIGIIERLSKSHQNNFKHIIDELPLDIERIKSINRKLNLASEKLSLDLEPEEFQAVGLICRESLVELSKELCKRNEELIKEKDFKASDFKNVASTFIDLYIDGSKNSALRSHSKKIVDIAWSYCSTIVHSQNKSYPDVKIALLFTSMAVSLLENLFLKYIGFDNEAICSVCGSKKIIIVQKTEDIFIKSCESCKNEEAVEQIEE
ncbi:hypothetical protein [Kaistella antarctica]|uniref:Uncharacterized protein n=1 Tax=Kaistella antarctica TaxID=266748 RepID=A0A3S4WS94_9FLAO|nr:hypothetical protein [Kaistella antarctica]KEY19066.1 hypothetical protein HY04_11555 [Kaistella antarctica]SEW12019.1 hypothetical protein SAMN05421765_2426 [Kaistella antarctica]VEH98953.1 Uncharacterised protein [Kaistella antarctica]